MNFIQKQILKVLILLIPAFLFSQNFMADSLRGSFTYLLQYKPIKASPDYLQKELFSLQISDDKAYFISENKIKFDSLFMSEFKKNTGNINLSNPSLRQSGSNFLIIQTYNYSQFYETVGMTLLSYRDPTIDNWKLSNETKIINSIVCKKAEVHFRGREWTAWYSTDIPFPYGPYKFSGLPGLIVKITDKKNDYDFELVKSVSTDNLKGKTVTVNNVRFTNSKLVKKDELVQARKNFRENARQQLENMGTVFSQEQKESPRERQQRLEIAEKNRNPIEIEE